MSATSQRGVEPTVETALETAMTDLYAKSRAAEFGLGSAQFIVILEDVAAKHAPAAEPCSRLHVEDLVLTRMCAVGNERAWEVFMLRFREKLYDVARQITREDSAGRELADSVYADLFGTRTREGDRISKLTSYSGRGSLEGWLRTVLAQEYVNTYRKQRRLVSLDEESEEGVQFAATPSEPAVVSDPRLENAIDAALGSLEAEERFILASYF